MRSQTRTILSKRGEHLNALALRRKIVALQERGTLGIRIFLFLINEDLEPDAREQMDLALVLAKQRFNKHTHVSRWPGLRGPYSDFGRRRRLIGAKA
jgi:hypothetical protein